MNMISFKEMVNQMEKEKQQKPEEQPSPEESFQQSELKQSAASEQLSEINEEGEERSNLLNLDFGHIPQVQTLEIIEECSQREENQVTQTNSSRLPTESQSQMESEAKPAKPKKSPSQKVKEKHSKMIN